jgi:hypothetical protein
VPDHTGNAIKSAVLPPSLAGADRGKAGVLENKGRPLMNSKTGPSTRKLSTRIHKYGDVLLSHSTPLQYELHSA